MDLASPAVSGTSVYANGLIRAPENDILKTKLVFVLFHGGTVPSGPGSPHYWGFTTTLRHTTLGRTPMDKRSARSMDFHLTKYNIQKRQISMPRRDSKPQSHTRAAADPRLRPRGQMTNKHTILKSGTPLIDHSLWRSWLNNLRIIIWRRCRKPGRGLFSPVFSH